MRRPALMLLLAGCTGISMVHAQQCFCLKSAHEPSGFILKMELTDEHWKHGYVQYNTSSERIPIVFKGTRELERRDGRPSYFRYTFEERYEGLKSGTYVLQIQGANVYESYYLRAKDRKKFVLERVTTEDDCQQCFSR